MDKKKCKEGLLPTYVSRDVRLDKYLQKKFKKFIAN